MLGDLETPHVAAGKLLGHCLNADFKNASTPAPYCSARLGSQSCCRWESLVPLKHFHLLMPSEISQVDTVAIVLESALFQGWKVVIRNVLPEGPRVVTINVINIYAAWTVEMTSWPHICFMHMLGLQIVINQSHVGCIRHLNIQLSVPFVTGCGCIGITSFYVYSELRSGLWIVHVPQPSQMLAVFGCHTLLPLQFKHQDNM